MLIAWLAAALASAGPPVIEAPEKIPMGISAQALPDGYRLTLKTTEMLEIGAAQARLLPEAKKLCGTRTSDFRKYAAVAPMPGATQPPGGPKHPFFILVQDIRCGRAGSSAPGPPKDDAPMSCEVGPAEKRFGGLPWHLYSCADRTTLIVYPARGNPAKAYFVFRRAGAAYQMVGEVGADKEVAGPAIEELKRLDPGQIIGLIAETRGDAFKATPDDEAQVKAVTERYFAARQTGDWRTAYDLLSPGLKEMSTFEAWRAAGQDFEAKAGRFVRRRLKRLTWYDNPGDAPEPGVYVAVDYEAEYKKLAVDCGYLMWLRGGDGGYRLMRQEDSVLERSLRETIDETSYKAFRAQYCRDPQ